ncbi:TetR/AcrR family transcriptional regulator [Clostridium thailandense]|uniref:TetR/AcrR family transcriptional regulator n=1 Tax=Clostridium thailandense TaxID=2794346 RepID=UPI00398990EB
MGTYDKARKHTEDKIIHAFWELYKTQKIEKITVKSITDACGIHRATFYLHYQDVYAILEHIETSLMKSLDDMNTTSIETDADMSNFASNLYVLFQQNHDYLHVLVREQKEPVFALAYKSKLKQKLKQIFQFTVEDFDRKRNAIIDMTLSSHVDIFIYWADESPFSFEEMKCLMKGYMLNGIYNTLRNNFDIQSFMYPFKDEFWDLGN